MLQHTKNIGRDPLTARAVPSDFCQVFSAEITGLYLLALLLTADEQLAERCFASALEDCLEADRVFRSRAGTWARRAIVKNAIGMMNLVPGTQRSSEPPASFDIVRPERGWPLAAVIQLPIFERVVFVMSVLESYSDQECKILLDCSHHEVLDARTRALARIRDATFSLPMRSVDARAVEPSINLTQRNYSDQLSDFGSSSIQGWERPQQSLAVRAK